MDDDRLDELIDELCDKVDQDADYTDWRPERRKKFQGLILFRMMNEFDAREEMTNA